MKNNFKTGFEETLPIDNYFQICYIWKAKSFFVVVVTTDILAGNIISLFSLKNYSLWVYFFAPDTVGTCPNQE